MVALRILMSIAAAPFRGATVVVLAILAICGLAAYGGKPELTA
jgi:hypothetical protein